MTLAQFTLGLDLLDSLEYSIGGTVVVVIGGKGPPLEHFYNCTDEFNCFVGDVDNNYSSGGANTVTSVTTPYEFISLNSDPHHLFQTSFSRPTINNHGIVAYIDNRWFSDRWVIIDDGTTRTEIDLDAAAGFDGYTSKAVINDQSAVAVVYPRRLASDGLLLRFNADNTVTTLATYNLDGLSGDFKRYALWRICLVVGFVPSVE